MYSPPHPHFRGERPIELYNNPDCPVPILQSKWEFERLIRIYRDAYPEKVLEIGSLFGGTLWHWMAHMQCERIDWRTRRVDWRGSFVTIDQLVPKTDPRYDEQLHCHKVKWPQWASERGVDLQIIEGDSKSKKNIEKAQKYGPYDFLFIDGDHSYDGVKADFETYKEMVREGGIVVFHDILHSPYWSSIQVSHFWKELKEQGYVTQELYSRPDQLFPHDGSAFGIGVVYL